MATTMLSQDQLESFQRDGYLVVQGLFEDDECMQQVVSAGEALVAAVKSGIFFSNVSKGAMYNNEASFQAMAIHSKVPKVAAELMQLDPKRQTMRILRDVFLAKEVTNDGVCGWHVDDQGFWPESYISTASKESGKDKYGINAWVALDDMPKAYEGSMAVARGSHEASWRWEAYEAIGQDRTKGGLTKDEFEQSAKFDTCSGIEEKRTDLQGKLDSVSEIFDLKRGDVIFATRLLFHKTMPVTPEGQDFFRKNGKENLMRYSIRYVPGSARLTEGFTSEWSILDNPANKGRSLDEVVGDEENEYWYPKVWPTVLDERKGSGQIDESKLVAVKEKEKEVFAEFRSLMQKKKEEKILTLS